MRKVESGLLAIVAALGFVLAPAAIKAQGPGPGQECNWCNLQSCGHSGCFYECTVIFSGEVCGEETEYGGGCEACVNPEEEEEEEDLLALSSLRPDGTVYAPGTLLDGISPDWFALIGTQVAEGVAVTRSTCSQDVVFMWQDDAVIDEVRAQTAKLTL